MLDVGCSNGRYSAWAALHGARRVVGLEPMGHGSGSSHDSVRYFNGFAERLGLGNMEIHPTTLQEYTHPPDTFDLVLMSAVINHLDEDACVELQRSEAARARYREIFTHLHAMMKDGGRLIATDAGRRYIWSDLGFRYSPFQRKIDFLKHQDPDFWQQLLAEVGFRPHRISWMSRNRYRQLAAPTRNRPMAYLMGLAFRLEMICRKS
jgi:SAM-dependent methyltransferase